MLLTKFVLNILDPVFDNLTHPPGQNGRHFADDIFKFIFMNEKFCLFFLIRNSLKFVPKGPIDN